MAKPVTVPTRASVRAFLAAIEDSRQREDCKTIAKMMREATGATPKMWGPSIVGYGSYHYRYASGREGDWFSVGFSPRKQSLSLYLMAGFDKHAALLKKLGKHKTGKGCLSVKRLDDVDLDVLRQLIASSVAAVEDVR